jgi:alpha-tubulin suppressor-like RCC1 family protein
MKARILSLSMLLFAFHLPSAFAQYTPKYIVGTAEYDCYVINSSTHHLYDVAGGTPYLIANQPAVVTQAAGALHHACVLDNAGNCYCWGDNANGEIGNGTTSATLVPAMSKVATDSAGNSFTNVVQIAPGGSSFGYLTAALKSDGTVWIWGATGGGNRGNGTQGSTNTRPVQVKFPAGTVIKKIQIDMLCIALDANGNVWTWGGNDGYVAPYVLAQATLSPDPTTPHKISLPSPAKDISGGNLWNYALLTNGSLYGWGYYTSYLGIGSSGFKSQAGAQVTPVLLDGQLGLPHPVASIYTNSAASYAILTDSTIWAWGDAAVGSIGNGMELDFSKYTTNPSPSGGTPNPYNWDWGPGELMVQKPVQIAKGLHSFTNLWTSGSDVFYCYAEDLNGNLYSWGRNKGGVVGNGEIGAGVSGYITAFYPNSWDVPWVTAVNPFAPAKSSQTTSPYCLLNPATSPCNSFSIPVTSAPAVSAGANQAIAGTTATLNGTATGNGGSSINYYLWTQVSGPNTPLIILNTGPVAQLTGLVTGTYVFQLKATDNNWRSNSATVTITVGQGATAPAKSITVNAGTGPSITLPVNSITLTGTATGNNGATISSTAWTQTAGPNTATIASPSALSTGVKSMIAGTYTFKLTAIGPGIDTSATVTATVGAAAVTSNPTPTGYTAIPGTVQAENYSTMSGVQTEKTVDAGGGLDVGWIDPGDWMDYNVSVATAGTFTVGFRVATPLSVGVLQLKNSAGAVLATINIPNTGNYEVWRTVTTTVTLPVGSQTLQVYCSGASPWNINWISFTQKTASAALQNAVTEQQAATLPADSTSQTTDPAATTSTAPATADSTGTSPGAKDSTTASPASKDSTLTAPGAKDSTTQSPEAANDASKILSAAATPSLTLYPNPAHDNITLNMVNEHTGKMNLQLINGSGQTIRTYALSKEGQTSTTNLNVSDLPAGAYFIRIQIGAWQTVKKLLKF